MNSHRKFIFTDIDLDGAMSYTLFTWLTGNKKIPYISTRVSDFKKSFQGWQKNNNVDKYDQIYILDLDISQDSIELVDRDNVVIIDHHESHVANKHKYKNAKVFISHESSCCRYIYNLLHKKSEVSLTDNHKHLILLADDYDSYKLKLKDSHSLNLLFWNYQGDRVRKFTHDFGDGFFGFTDQQANAISFHRKKIDQVISELDIFSADLPISNNSYKFVSTFATSCINDVADHIIKEYNADVGIVVNLQSNKVSFRKGKEVDLDLSKLANKLASGGGHKYASGGSVTETFMNFSRLLKPHK